MAETPSRNASPPRARKLPWRKWLGWGIVVALGVGGYVWWTRSHSGSKTGKMITAKVSRGDLTETITATGSVVAQTGAEVHIGSQITGVIKRLYADVGQEVKANAVIAELDLPDLTAQLHQAQASMAAADEKARQAQTTLAQTTLETMSQVRLSQAALESSRQKYLSAQATASQSAETVPTDVRKAESALSSATAALSTAKSNLNQVQAGAALQIATSQATLNSAKANAAKADADLARNQQLYNQQFLSASDLDAAIATAKVNRAAVDSAQQNLGLTQQKVDADLQTAKDGVTQADQNVVGARAALKAAVSESHSVTARSADQADARAAMVQAQASLEVAKANLQNVTLRRQDLIQAQDSARQASQLVAFNQAQVNKAIIRSPISGTVLNLTVQQGETLAAGLSAPTVIVVADLNRLEVDAFVDETDIGKVRIGQPVQVTVDSFPDKIVKGTVFKIASGSTIQQGVVTYDVSVKLENPGHLLKPDMTASVTIQTGSQHNVLVVPSVAVQVGVRNSRVNVLTVVNGEQKITPVIVKTGGTDGLNTQILSGLNEGDTIVVAGGPTQGGGGRGPVNPFGPSSSKKGGGG
ncbi:MAG TPA: efflux RND transporter periplasmic adaptor subunit [Fimbriimonadaceae bacterium]|nr:efflux RND transporter periplasmic adaptor subunit [Fimbriimonadaceae bacterium]